MNLNITIDLQEIFDNQNETAYNDGYSDNGGSSGYNLKESIKQEIINGLKGSISKDCLKLVEEKSKAAIQEVMQESITSAKNSVEREALSFAKDWLESKKVITDKWGDPQKESSMRDLIKESFDKLLERKVNDRGQFCDSYASNSITLVKYLSGQMVKEEVTGALKDFRKDIDNQIKAYIESGIKESVSNKFAEMVIQTAASQNQKIESK